MAEKHTDGSFELVPVLPKERVWGGFDFSMVNIGLAIATWSFLIGGTLSTFVNLKMAIAATLAGNTIGLIIMALSTTISSSKYGIDQYISLRSVFGMQGTKITLFIILILEFGWISLLSIMFGKASANVINVFTQADTPSITVTIIFAIIAILVVWWIVAKGPLSINWLNRLVAPGLVIVILWMLYVLFSQYSFSEILALQPAEASEDRWWNYMIAFELGLGSGLSWWPIMGGLSRLTKSQRTAFWPNMIGLNLCAVIATMVGLIAGLATGSSDPTEWMVPLGGPVVGIIVLVFIGFGNITSMTSMAYSTSMALKQIKFLDRLRWERLTALLLLPVIALVFFPDQIYNSFSSFLALCGTVLGPLSAIALVDYFFLRKQTIQLADLYKEGKGTPFHFWNGFNFAAVVALIVGTASYFFILDPLTFENASIFLYSSASLPAALIAGIVYYLIYKAVVAPKGLGGYQ